MYAIQSLNELPSIERMKANLKAMALLDAVMSPDWEFRYFSFNARWVEDGSEAMASMGDKDDREYFFLFDSNGVVGKVLVYDHVLAPTTRFLLPEQFASFRNEPAFDLDHASYFVWRSKEDSDWNGTSRPENMNGYHLLGFIAGGPDVYHAWAEGYYEREIDLGTVCEVFASGTLTLDQVSRLAPDLDYADLAEDIAEITGV